MPGVVETSVNFAANQVITSTLMNNIIDQTLFTDQALADGTATLELVAGRMKVATNGITATEMATGAVTATAIADGAVTQAKTSNMLVPAGAIMAFAMNGAPTGWLAADGTAVSRSTYATLFAAIATTYGVGDGSTTFNLPDLRGYFVRGTGTNSDGTVSGTFAAKQADELKSHTHTYTFKSTTGGTSAGGDPNSIGNTSVNTGATGGTETRPKNIAMFYCIKI